MFRRIVRTIRNIFVPEQPPVPPPEPPRPPVSPPTPPEEPEFPEYGGGGGGGRPEEIDIDYIPPSNDIEYFARDGAVLGRWQVGDEFSPPSLGDVEELMRQAEQGRIDNTYTFIIYGVPAEDSPIRRKTRNLAPMEPGWLGARKTFNNSWQALGGANTIEDYFNNLMRIDQQEWTRIDTIQILDKRKETTVTVEADE